VRSIGDAATVRPAPRPASPPTAALADLADRFWVHYLATNPEWATTIGDRRFDAVLSDVSPAAVEADARFSADVATAAQAIDPAHLAPADQVTRAMLIEEAAGRAAVLQTGVHEWTVDPLEGPTVRLLDLVDYQPLRTATDGQSMVERWLAIGPYLDAVAENHRRALAVGRVAARPPVERVIDELRGLEARPPETWKLAEPANLPLDGWDPGDAAGLRSAILASVRDVVAPAFRRYREVLEREVLPLARPVEAPGIIHVPGGEAVYRSLVRFHTTLDVTPAELHEIGLEEIGRIDAEFVALGRRLLGTSDLASTVGRLRDDPALRFSTAGEVFEVARRSLARAQAAVPEWFGRVPAAACVVVPVPGHSAAHQTIAYYTSPAFDGSRPGRYYINLHAPETRPRYEAEALAFHESVPGHHLQIAIAQELADLPAFQRMLGSTAFVEGWGLYTERLADEMGLYATDLDRFGILSFDAWRAGRLVVDTGMHALGWSRQEAIDFLATHTALGQNNIANEVDRYIVWPGQALAYKTGQLEFLRLRRAAEARLGARFDVGAFHDVVLGSGAVSLPVLRSIVEGWLATAGV
jgi:uncharacterized protein (DUF885 family)